MTGTPVENRLSDLWSLVDFLNPGLLGTAKEFGSFVKRIQEAPVPSFDATGMWITPGFIDCHTHLVYAGNRAGEFEQRLLGASYEQIARAGGGIQSTVDATRTIIARNDSPDISFDRSINPYRGCEHGCVYCFARPTHAYLGLSPGLDFESKLFVKPEAAALLERELSAPNYTPRVIAIGTNTDPYQPIERRYQVMRRILEVLERAGHPVGIVTKSALVLRDLDILARMAERRLAKVALSVTTLDPDLARTMEPRAATPARRLETASAGRSSREWRWGRSSPSSSSR